MSASMEGVSKPVIDASASNQSVWYSELRNRIFASSCGALATSLLMTPLDVIKVRMQAAQAAIINGRAGAVTAQKTFARRSYCICSNGLQDYLRIHDPQFLAECKQHQIARSGTVGMISQIVRKEGFFRLWSGLSATIFTSIPATVIYFSSYDFIKYKAGFDERRPETLWIAPIAACSCRAMSSTLTSPVELVRTKMQSERISYREIRRALSDLVAERGLRALFLGLPPTLMRDVPFSAVYWIIYEFSKSNILYYRQAYATTTTNRRPTLTFSEAFIAGSFAGTVAALLTLPFDVVKTYRQMELGESLFQGSPVPTDPRSQSHALASVLRRIYKERGVSGLFSGVVPRIAKIAPACAIMIAAFESGKSVF